MTVSDLAKYTKLSILEINTLAADAKLPADSSGELDMQVVIRAAIVNIFTGCYPDRKLEILTYLRLVDAEGGLTSDIQKLIDAFETVQTSDTGAAMPLRPLILLSVIDSRFVGVFDVADDKRQIYDMVTGTLCYSPDIKWPWLSMTVNISVMLLRDRVMIQHRYPNVGLYGSGPAASIRRYDSPITADTSIQ